MSHTCKAKWLEWAEIVDSIRLVPRMVLLIYGIWMIRLTDWVVRWYEHLPKEERTPEVTAFASVVLPGVFGLACWVFKLYISTPGRDWGQANQDDHEEGHT
jgi:hypothetical protein